MHYRHFYSLPPALVLIFNEGIITIITIITITIAIATTHASLSGNDIVG